MKFWKVLLPCFLVGCSPTVVKAGDFGNWAMASVFGYSGHNRPVVVNNFTPPYFSLHPPVYYGERYYRPYGDSPFASWPQLQPNSTYMPRPQTLNHDVVVIDNSYCPQPIHAAPEHSAPLLNPAPTTPAEPVQPSKAPDVVKSKSAPSGMLVIENPYFSDPSQYVKKQEPSDSVTSQTR